MHLLTKPPAPRAEQCWAPAMKAPGQTTAQKSAQSQEAPRLQQPGTAAQASNATPLPSAHGFTARFIACFLRKGFTHCLLPYKKISRGRIQEWETKQLWGLIKRKEARVKEPDQGSRKGHQTPPKSIHHSSKASKEPGHTAQCEMQWE